MSNKSDSGVNAGAGSTAKKWKTCGKCGKPGQSRMVTCSECQSSFHYECVRITSEVLDGPWVCNGCLRRTIEANNNVLQIKLQEEQQKRMQHDQQQRQLERQWRELNPDLNPQQSRNVEFLRLGDQIVKIVRQGDSPLAESTPVNLDSELAPRQDWMEARLRQLDNYNQDLLNQIDMLQRLNPQGTESGARNPLYEFPPPNNGSGGKTDAVRGRPSGLLDPIPERKEPAPSTSESVGSIATKVSRGSVALRAQRLKALEERQALERKQLEEKLALEQELLEQETVAGSDVEQDGSASKSDRNSSTDSNFLNITNWLEDLERSGEGAVSTPRGNRTKEEGRAPADTNRMLIIPAYERT
ncbi:conserved hypothetical protein [Culex quinquefasciatus]|uniref:PHD-type domain-containing protein n=1 Tax=Culex quinquefasciatus TaxID=7176 RepID=B0WWI9_CULQU|nr:conserved hypothetical protein [Culex quinquefasciatus]|eukprot:XP_001861761.1 conserved hypothetical protein [Culex quinquefasciatus]